MSNKILTGPESPLRVNIEDGELVIRVGMNRLDGHDRSSFSFFPSISLSVTVPDVV